MGAADMLWKDPWNCGMLADKYQLYADNPAFAGGMVWTRIDSRRRGSILSACGLRDQSGWEHPLCTPLGLPPFLQ